MKKNRLLFIFVLVIMPHFWSQSPLHIIYDDASGLLDFEQYDLLKDPKGYIWIAGNSGLHRFNSRSFVHFSTRSSPSRALTGMRLDQYHRIWMHDFAGNVYFFHQGKLVRFPLWNPLKSATFPIIESDGNCIWIIAEEKVYTYENAPNFKEIKWSSTLHLKTSRVACVFKKKLFVVGENEVFSIDKNISKYPLEGSHKPQFLKAWSSLINYNNRLILFVRDENSIYELKNKTFQLIKKFDFLSDFITMKIVANEPWILTRNGVLRLNESFEVKEHLFEGFACSDLLQDSQGNFWMSTLNKGVVFFSDLDARIYNLEKKVSFSKLLYAGQTLFAGTNDGILCTLNKNNLQSIYASKTQKEIGFLSYDSFGKTLYFGESEIQKIGKTKFQTIGTNPSIKQLTFIYPSLALIADPSGIYVSLFKGYKYPNELSPSFLRKLLPKETPRLPFFSYKYLLNIRTSRFSIWKNNLFAATKNGLFEWSDREKKKCLYKGQRIFVTDFESTPKGLICATSNLGVLLWDGKSWKKLNNQIGLSQFNYIQQVCFSNDVIWFATDAGLIQMDLKTKKHHLIDASNGLLSTKVADMVVVNHYLYIATNNGILRFPTKKAKNKWCNPPFYLVKVKVNGLEKKVNCLQNIESNPGVVSLQWDAIWYASKNRLHVSYKMDADEKWSILPNGFYQINLTRLTPGEHNLLVRLHDNVSGKVIKSKLISFFVTPTFFQRTSVQVICILLVLLITVILVYSYLKAIKRKNLQLIEKERLQQELKQSMLSAIKAQMNPHFIFNALNTIQSYVLTNDRMKANYYLGKFSDLMRKILTMSNQETITIEEEINALKLYLELENMRLNDELEIVFDTKNVEPILHRQIPSMIVQPYVENALKHGLLHKTGQKSIQIIFTVVSEFSLLVEITDNGIGRQASYKMKQRSNKHYSSFSTNANKKRLELLNEQSNNDISVQIIDLQTHEVACGTKVLLCIPFK